MRDMTGYFVRSIAGHDKGQLYFVINSEKSLVTVADGKLKKVKKPKVKNKKHIEIVKNDCDNVLMEKIKNGDKDINEAIKRKIKLYNQEEKNV